MFRLISETLATNKNAYKYVYWDWWAPCFSQKCHNSWQRLRQSPIFGCFCPSNLAQVTYKSYRYFTGLIFLAFWFASPRQLFFFFKIISPSSRIMDYNWKYDLAQSCFVIGNLEILDAAAINKNTLLSTEIPLWRSLRACERQRLYR